MIGRDVNEFLNASRAFALAFGEFGLSVWLVLLAIFGVSKHASVDELLVVDVTFNVTFEETFKEIVYVTVYVTVDATIDNN